MDGRATQPVQLPDCHGVAGLQRGQQVIQALSVPDRPGHAMITLGQISARRFEGINLQSFRLVVIRDPEIADLFASGGAGVRWGHAIRVEIAPDRTRLGHGDIPLAKKGSLLAAAHGLSFQPGSLLIFLWKTLCRDSPTYDRIDSQKGTLSTAVPLLRRGARCPGGSSGKLIWRFVCC